jgi:hypothetical protein
MIERMVNGGARLELFARPHNQREGWLGVGDEAIFHKPKPEKVPAPASVYEGQSQLIKIPLHADASQFALDPSPIPQPEQSFH